MTTTCAPCSATCGHEAGRPSTWCRHRAASQAVPADVVAEHRADACGEKCTAPAPYARRPYGQRPRLALVGDGIRTGMAACPDCCQVWPLRQATPGAELVHLPCPCRVVAQVVVRDAA